VLEKTLAKLVLFAECQRKILNKELIY
jgi:hypothetical protein